jgi:hypothetical protein
MHGVTVRAPAKRPRADRSGGKAISLVWALKQDDPVKRVACLLLILSEENLAGTGIAASQWDIAELINLGRSKVNSSLKALEGRGHIRRRYGSIEVTNAVGLRDFIAGPSERARE